MARWLTLGAVRAIANAACWAPPNQRDVRLPNAFTSDHRAERRRRRFTSCGNASCGGPCGGVLLLRVAERDSRSSALCLRLLLLPLRNCPGLVYALFLSSRRSCSFIFYFSSYIPVHSAALVRWSHDTYMEPDGRDVYNAPLPSVTLSYVSDLDSIHSWTIVAPSSAHGQNVVPPSNLLDLLSNSLILRQTAPYLSVSSICALAATCKGFHDQVYDSPDMFRYLDLSTTKRAMIDDSGPIDSGGFNWRAERMDEALTEDEFYAGPLRGIFSGLNRKQVLRNISTLILDGLSVPADVVREIVAEDKYSVRILSIREAKHLNERKLCQVLKYAVRPSRPAGTPKLKGLYVFGPMEPALTERAREESNGRKRSPTRYPDSDPNGAIDAVGAQLSAEWNRKSQQAMQLQLAQTHDRWWRPSGRMFRKTPASEWAETLQACEGIIAFDAVLCRGPKHDPPKQTPNNEQTHNYLPPAVATIALGSARCVKCGSCPEGWTTFEYSPSHHLPLLAPPPLHSSTVKAAQKPLVSSNDGETLGMVARCADCLRGRWCERCQWKWWCENCYTPATRTQLQQQEFAQQAIGIAGESWTPENHQEQEIKVHVGLCVDTCLVGELMSGLRKGLHR